MIKLRSLTWEEYSGLSDGPGLTQKSAQDGGRCVLGLEGSVTMNPRVDGWRDYKPECVGRRRRQILLEPAETPTPL